MPFLLICISFLKTKKEKIKRNRTKPKTHSNICDFTKELIMDFFIIKNLYQQYIVVKISIALNLQIHTNLCFCIPNIGKMSMYIYSHCLFFHENKVTSSTSAKPHLEICLYFSCNNQDNSDNQGQICEHSRLWWTL